MSDQPQPTGEWTAKTVLELWQMGGAGCDTNSRMIDIANAHNAEVAAERERLEKQWGREGIHITMERLTQELAAEREKAKALQEWFDANPNHLGHQIKQLREQRDEAIAEALEKERIATVSRLDQQLAKAVAEAKHFGWNEGREHERKCAAAAQKPLVDALKLCLSALRHEDGSSQMRACIAADVQLAKVKKKK